MSNALPGAVSLSAGILEILVFSSSHLLSCLSEIGTCFFLLPSVICHMPLIPPNPTLWPQEMLVATACSNKQVVSNCEDFKIVHSSGMIASEDARGPSAHWSRPFPAVPTLPQVIGETHLDEKERS